jgi:hypothetical protein
VKTGHIDIRGTTLLAALLTVAGCSSSQTASLPPAATPNVAAASTLQLAVGTATIGIAGGASSVGLNVVATFRQPNGNNATNVNTPTLTAPPGMSFGPLLGNSNVITGVSPATMAALAAQANAFVPSATATAFTLPVSFGDGFGPFVGVFGYGLAGDNLVSNSDFVAIGSKVSGQTNGFLGNFCAGFATAYAEEATGAADGGFGLGAYYGNPPAVTTPAGTTTTSDLVRSAELALPIPSGTRKVESALCTCPSACAVGATFADPAFPVQYFGGPPAWPSPQGYGNYSYFVGYPLGFTMFTAAPKAGTYSLAVSYPTNATYTAFGSISKTAALRSLAPLPLFPQPVLTINSDGSGSVNVDVPSGVHEAVITIATNDCDLAGRNIQPVYYDHYALETEHTGPQTLFLSSSLGPPSTVTGLPTHTFCTVSDLQAGNAATGAVQQSFPLNTSVNAVGFDYPAYESSYPFDMGAAPTISNAGGQADVTTSYPLYVSTTISIPTGG